MITRTTPTTLRLEGLPEAELRRQLAYIDRSVDFELKKASKSDWLRNKLGPEGYKEHIDQLKAKRNQTLLFEDSKGFWTYSGLGEKLADKFNTTYQDLVKYPEANRIPWARVPEKQARPYQEQMKELLLAARHGAVEVGTGLGKSFVIMLLAKELGLKTVVMTPSVSIAEQIYAEFKHHLGDKYVGKFFDGTKKSEKLFTVAVDDSLTKIEEGSPHWKNLSKAQVFIADESHLCPAKSLAKVCTGLLADAPYRFFFSGTQMRNDGLDLLLEAITGKIVFRMTVEDGVDQGWLAKPLFRMIPLRSTCTFSSHDANEMTRAHLYYEPTVNSKAGEIANLMVEEMGRQVVILVKELEQYAWLKPYLRHEARFAHGGVTKDNQDKVPEEFWKSDPTELVKAFNRGEFPILVGTSCITTGTDIQTVGAIIYMQGGKSEIQVKQSVGRGTRKPEGKVDCYFIDFDMINAETVHRHAEERAAIYQGIYPDFEIFPL
jgi:superfamily II DNA or RNA helicase